MFGFCLTNNHDDCPERFKRWYWETKRGKSVRVSLDEYAVCDCHCHSEE